MAEDAAKFARALQKRKVEKEDKLELSSILKENNALLDFRS